jgi:hypothetical protein
MPSLAERLKAAGYLSLFYALDGAPAEAVWRETGAEGLRGLLADVSADAEARFLAAELLAARGAAPGLDAATALAVDVAALRQTRLGNIWGMPGAPDTPAARRVIAQGAAAAAALRPLLDDARQVWFAGSIEASEANDLIWRVRDIAASLIAAIEGHAFPARAPMALRDAAIARYAAP